MSSMLELTRVDFRFDHPECATWGPDDRVYAGGEAGQIYRINVADGSVEEFANTGGFVLGVALDADANVYACDLSLKQVIKVTPNGSCSVYSSGTSDRPMELPNYPVFDEHGAMYVSDSGVWGEENGFIWRLAPGGEAEVWTEAACGYTNGMCLSPDGHALYVTESSPPVISRIEIEDDGRAGDRSVVLELPRTVPDGIAFDQDGNMFIALFNPNVIHRYSTNGVLTVLYEDWEQLKLFAPTNIIFAGQDLKTLVIAGVGGWSIHTARMDVAGVPLKYPKLR